MNTKETLPETMGRQLTDKLLTATRWLTTGEFRHSMGFTRRDCKTARDAAGPFNITSTGKGYRATELCTDAELAEAQTMFESQEEAARLNAEGVLAVRLSRLEASIAVVDEHHARIKAASDAIQRGEVIDLWAVLNRRDRA